MHLHTEPTQARVQPGPRFLAHHRSGHLPAQQDDVEFGMLLGDLGRGLDGGQPAAGHHDGAVAARGSYAGVLGLYPAWCAFATLLSTRIWLLNRDD
jgi:hypothetical protein